MSALLRLERFSVRARQAESVRDLVRDVHLELAPHTARALVGETGAGKTALLLGSLGLLAAERDFSHLTPGAATALEVSGSVQFDGAELTSLDSRALSEVLRRSIALCPQRSDRCFDPFRSVRATLSESLAARGSRRDWGTFITLLEQLGGADLLPRLDESPSMLSAASRQLLYLAAVLTRSPRLLVLDDTLALIGGLERDVMQDWLRTQVREQALSVWFVSNDLGLVQALADDVDVMVDGLVVETGPAELILHSPAHPYTHGLLTSNRSLAAEGPRLPRLPVVTGADSPVHGGCHFRPRCALYRELESQEQRCEKEPPPLREVAPKHFSRCHFAEDVRDP